MQVKRKARVGTALLLLSAKRHYNNYLVPSPSNQKLHFYSVLLRILLIRWLEFYLKYYRSLLLLKGVCSLVHSVHKCVLNIDEHSCGKHSCARGRRGTEEGACLGELTPAQGGTENTLQKSDAEGRCYVDWAWKTGESPKEQWLSTDLMAQKWGEGRSRLGKLNLDSKLGILKRGKKACISKYSRVREAGQQMKSEMQEVNDYCGLLGQARDWEATGKLLKTGKTWPRLPHFKEMKTCSAPVWTMEQSWGSREATVVGELAHRWQVWKEAQEEAYLGYFRRGKCQLGLPIEGTGFRVKKRETKDVCKPCKVVF